MSGVDAESAIYTLLSGASAVTALVGPRIYNGELPQGVAMPAVGYTHISTVPVPALDAFAAYVLVRSRIEVVALAKDLVGMKDLLRKVRAACNYQRGVINGVQVNSILRELEGPTTRNSDMTLFAQTIDFMVTWQEPNP